MSVTTVNSAIRPDPASSVLLRFERLYPGSETLCGILQLVGDHLRILLLVPLFDGCLVLVPVGEGRRVFVQHLGKTGVERR